MERKDEPCWRYPCPTRPTSTGWVSTTSSLLSATSHAAEPYRSVYQEPGMMMRLINPEPVFMPLALPFAITPHFALMTSRPDYMHVMGYTSPQVPLTTGAGVVPWGICSILDNQYRPMLTQTEGPSGSTTPTPQIVGSRKKPTPCDKCDKSFVYLSRLNNHYRTVHAQDESLSCFGCGKCFSTKSQLASHRRTETPSYPCPKCGEILRDCWDMHLHKRMHFGKSLTASQTDDKHGECGQTLKRSSVKPQISDPCSCPECGTGSSRGVTRDTHQKTRTGEIPYSCSDCGKCFSWKSTLITHRRIHTGERPISCPHCGTSFRETGSLLRHRRRRTT